MIVEFIGLPGAGKSTLHSDILARIRDMGMPVCTPSSLPSKGCVGGKPQAGGFVRFWNYLAASRTYPRVVCLAIRCLAISRRPIHEKWFGLRLFWVALGRRYMAGRLAEGPRWILFDEGLMQRAFTLFVDRSGIVDVGEAIRYVQLAPLPHVLVYVKSDPTVALDRLSARQRGLADRFTGISSEHAIQMMANGQQMFEGMLEEIGRSSRTMATFIVDGNNLDAAWAELDEQLLRHLREEPTPNIDSEQLCQLSP